MNRAVMENYLTRLEEKTKEHYYPKDIVTGEALSRWFDSVKDENGNVRLYAARSCFDSTDEDIYLKKHSDFYAGRFSYPHYHDFFEFNFVCRGSCVNIVDGNRIVQTPDTLILMNLNAAHQCITQTTEDQVVNLLLRKSVVEHIFLQLLSSEDPLARFFLDSLYSLPQIQNYMTFSVTEEISNIFWHLTKEFLEQKGFFRQVMLADTLTLFAGLARSIQDPQLISPAHSDKASELLSYLRRNYATATLQQTADAFHYSTGHVSRILKEQTGKSFLQLLTEYRLESACNYLKNSSISAENIAEIVGYHDISHFYKLFKKRYGKNPRDYRKNL